jgi:hypothetical protein
LKFELPPLNLLTVQKVNLEVILEEEFDEMAFDPSGITEESSFLYCEELSVAQEVSHIGE